MIFMKLYLVCIYKNVSVLYTYILTFVVTLFIARNTPQFLKQKKIIMRKSRSKTKLLTKFDFSQAESPAECIVVM